MGAFVSAWGNSWGNAWGNSWGAIASEEVAGGYFGYRGGRKLTKDEAEVLACIVAMYETGLL